MANAALKNEQNFQILAEWRMRSRQTNQPTDGPTDTNNKKDALLIVKFFEKPVWLHSLDQNDKLKKQN